MSFYNVCGNFIRKYFTSYSLTSIFYRKIVTILYTIYIQFYFKKSRIISSDINHGLLPIL